MGGAFRQSEDSAANYWIKMADTTWRISPQKIMKPDETRCPDDNFARPASIVCSATLWIVSFVLIHIAGILVMILVRDLEQSVGIEYGTTPKTANLPRIVWN